jgi:hypothetical protein
LVARPESCAKDCITQFRHSLKECEFIGEASANLA